MSQRHRLVLLIHVQTCHLSSFFFFNDTATTEIYTLSLHDALPISCKRDERLRDGAGVAGRNVNAGAGAADDCLALADRKSTRLNFSHTVISYAVFCLKKKK